MGMIKAGKKSVVEKVMRILALFLVCVLVANGSGLSVFAAEIGDANAEETMNESESGNTEEPEETEQTVIEDTQTTEGVASGNWGETVYWTLNTKGVLTITQDPNAEFEIFYDEEPWIEYTDAITKIVWGANCFRSDKAEISPAISFGTKYNGQTFSKLEEIVFSENVSMSMVTDMSLMFEGCENLKILDVTKFDTSNVKNMHGMFKGCSSLETLNISNFDTKKVENMSNMFDGCNSLASLDISSFNTENVQSMQMMFRDCESLEKLDLNHFITDRVVSMPEMFAGCSGLTALQISDFNTSNVMYMNGMFSNCNSLTVLDVSTFCTDDVINMNGMFEGCSSLAAVDVSNFDTAKTFDMSRMFKGCSNLTIIDVSGFDTSSLQGMNAMFEACTGLQKLDLSSFDLSYVSAEYGIVPVSDRLYEIKAPKNLKSEISLSGEWVRTDTNEAITMLPKGLTESVVLRRTDIAPFIGVTNITLNETEVTLDSGDSLQLIATIEPSDATDKSIEWSTSNEEVVSVSASGLVKAHKAGTATITVKALGGEELKATCTIQVIQRASNLVVTLDKCQNESGEYILVKGDTVSPSISWENGEVWPEVSYEVNNDTAVVEDGKLIAMNPGYGVLTVTAGNGDKIGPKVTVPYRVYEEVTAGISLNVYRVVLDPEKQSSYHIDATIENEDSAYPYVKFTVDNPELIQITQHNNSAEIELVEGASGKAKVTASAIDGSGISATCEVIIGTSVDYVTVYSTLEYDSENNFLLQKGETAKFWAEIYPADATIKTVKWYSNDENVIKVDEEGNVTAIDSGIAAICAIPMDGTHFVGVALVRVTRPATALDVEVSGVNEGKVALGAPEEDCIFTLSPVLTAEDGTTDGVLQNAEYSLSGKGVKSVIYLGEGKFKAVAPGTLTITTTAKGNPSLKKSVTVTIEQHVYDLDVQAPKNIGTYQDEGGVHWIAYTGSKPVTLKPVVTYNHNSKEFAPAKEYKNFEIVIPKEAKDILTVDKKGTGIVVAKNATAGFYPVTILNKDSNISKTFIVDVVAANETYIQTVDITLPKTVKVLQDEVQPIAEGSKVKLSGVLNGGEKAKGYKLTWAVEEKGDNTGKAAISKAGVLDLSAAKVGDLYTVILTVSKGDISQSGSLAVKVTKKADVSAIKLVLAEDESKVLPASFSVQYENNGKVFRVAEQEGSANLYRVTGGKKGILSLEETDGGYIVRAEGTGSTKITVTALDGSNSKKVITVTIVGAANPISKISLKSKSYYIEPGKTIEIPYSVVTKNGKAASDTRIEWTSSDQGILKVTPDMFESEKGSCITDFAEGYLILVPTQRMLGKVTLTGKALDGSKRTVKITINVVSAAKKEMTTSLSLQVPKNIPNGGVEGLHLVTYGKKVKFTTNVNPNKAKNKTISYTVVGVDTNGNRTLSMDELQTKGISIKNGVLTVSKKCTYTGYVRVISSLDYRVYRGKTAIPVTSNKLIYIQPAATKVEITNEAGEVIKSATCAAGETMLLHEKVTATGTLTYANVSWSVSDSKIASVTSDGCVSIRPGVKKGKKVKVTATALDGTKKKAVITITVK